MDNDVICTENIYNIVRNY